MVVSGLTAGDHNLEIPVNTSILQPALSGAASVRRPVLSISSTDHGLLRYALTAIGAGRITGKVRSRAHHSPSFAYAISGRQALTVLSQVVPYLRTYKLDRARLLLGEYIDATPRNGRYTPEQRAKGTDFEDRFFAISTRAPSLKSASL